MQRRPPTLHLIVQKEASQHALHQHPGSKISPVFEKNRTRVHAMSMLGDLVRVATATKFVFLLYLHTLLLNAFTMFKCNVQ